MFSGKENRKEGEKKKEKNNSCHLTKNAKVTAVYSLDALQCSESLRDSGISLGS